MELESITRIASTAIAAFVTFRSYQVYNSVSGKVKTAAGFITFGMLALTVIEGMAYLGLDEALGPLMSVYWSSDIIISILLLGAISALKGVKK